MWKLSAEKFLKKYNFSQTKKKLENHFEIRWKWNFFKDNAKFCIYYYWISKRYRYIRMVAWHPKSETKVFEISLMLDENNHGQNIWNSTILYLIITSMM